MASKFSIALIGVGHAGIRVLNEISNLILNNDAIHLIAIDSDAQSLKSVTSSHIKIVETGFDWTDGLGTGGDLLRGERCAAQVRDSLLNMMDTMDVVILTGGIGGGMASGGLPLFYRAMIRMRKPLIIIPTIPFKFEGQQRHINAKTALNELKGADVLLPVANDLLFSSVSHDLPAQEAFKLADRCVAEAINGIFNLFLSDPLIPAGYANLKNLIAGKRASAGIGVAITHNTLNVDCFTELLGDMVNSPLLGGPRFLKEADALLCIMTASSDISIGEMRKALDNLKSHFSTNATIVNGLHVNPEYKNTAQLTVIALKFDPGAIAEKINRNETAVTKTAARLRQQVPIHSGTIFNEQPELPLQELTRGIFSNAPLTLIEGQDFDIPTYQRFSIQIDQA